MKLNDFFEDDFGTNPKAVEEAKKAANTKTVRQALSKRPRAELSDKEKAKEKADSDAAWERLMAYADEQKKKEQGMAEGSVLDRARDKLGAQGYMGTQADRLRDRERHREYMDRLHQSSMHKLDKYQDADDAYHDSRAAYWNAKADQYKKGPVHGGLPGTGSDPMLDKAMNMFIDRMNRYQYKTQRDVDPEQLAAISNIKYKDEVDEGIARAVDAKGRTQQQWIQAVYKKFPDARIAQAKMIDGPCYAFLPDGRKLSWKKVEQGMAEGSLNEFAPGNGGGESGRWYTDDDMTNIVGDGWWQDLDISGDVSKQEMINEAQAWLVDNGYRVQVLNVKVNDDDCEWFIEGSFQNNRFAKKGVAEGSNSVGNAIKSLYQKIYAAGDDEIDYFYHASPIFAQYWDEYEGDLDSIIAEVDPSELEVIKAELESYVDDANLTEAPGAETLAHNQSTVASNEKAFDLEEVKNKKPEQPEADYGPDYQDMVARVKKLAGLGPLKTVYDPQKRVYKNVPTAVQPNGPKKL